MQILSIDAPTSWIDVVSIALILAFFAFVVWVSSR